jgi:hypothetical protein
MSGCEVPPFGMCLPQCSVLPNHSTVVATDIAGQHRHGIGLQLPKDLARKVPVCGIMCGTTLVSSLNLHPYLFAAGVTYCVRVTANAPSNASGPAPTEGASTLGLLMSARNASDNSSGGSKYACAASAAECGQMQAGGGHT